MCRFVFPHLLVFSILLSVFCSPLGSGLRIEWSCCIRDIGLCCGSGSHIFTSSKHPLVWWVGLFLSESPVPAFLLGVLPTFPVCWHAAAELSLFWSFVLRAASCFTAVVCGGSLGCRSSCSYIARSSILRWVVLFRCCAWECFCYFTGGIAVPATGLGCTGVF